MRLTHPFVQTPVGTMADPDQSPQPISRQPREGFRPNPTASLRGQVHEAMRFLHYSPRTEETYWQWIVRFLRFHRQPALDPAREGNVNGWRHPRELGAAEVGAFLSDLATTDHVAGSTQNQSLYRKGGRGWVAWHGLWV